MGGDRLRRPLRLTVTVLERGAVDPRLERVLVLPARVHEPRVAVVGRPQQLELLEPGLAVDGAEALGEPGGQLVAATLGNGDCIDLDDAHDASTLRHCRFFSGPHRTASLHGKHGGVQKTGNGGLTRPLRGSPWPRPPTPASGWPARSATTHSCAPRRR